MDVLAEVDRKAPLYRSGKAPRGLKAAAEYINAALEGQPISQEELAEKFGVSSTTIRRRYAEMCRILGVTEKVHDALSRRPLAAGFSHP